MKRRDIFPLAAALPLLGAAGSQLADAVVDPAKAKLTHEPFGEQRIYFNGPTGQLRSMTAGSLRLKPGMEPHPPHQHPDEEFILVTEGRGEILVDGEKHQVGPGSMMYSAADRLHGIKNTGAEPLLFYFYKWIK
jgi:quercetin dioxygenase-like cupin family protein